MDEDHKRRESNARREAIRAEVAYGRRCVTVGTDPDDVEAALAEITEVECMNGNGHA